MRYSGTRIRAKNGVRYRSTAEYPDVSEKDSDIYVITQYGDRLDTIAMDFYKNPHMWWIIAKANGLSDLNIKQGTSLRIPILTDDIRIK
tara:strand:+ start:190 stop:456 length:267 start_codon:yes stop_codon:yes gene_type:complete